MSKARDAHGKSKASPAKAPLQADFKPLQPRRGLLILFAILLIVLFAGLLGMYFQTVYPNRDKAQPVERDAR
jgi:hypothetical protein